MVKLVALVGGGVIGSGWAARCLAKGLDVLATDPAPDAEQKIRAALENAWHGLSKIGLTPGASIQRFRFVTDIETCVREADFVQESAPEREELKLALHERIAKAARKDAIIASSSSGLLPTRIYAKALLPERCLIAHPFNPVYLLPLVELVAGERTQPETIEKAAQFYRHIGMRPLHVKKEIDGYIADRLLEALWREALHLVNDGIASTEEIDDAIRFGPGLRWSFWGTNLIYHLAGGEDGMRHMLEQFGPALELPWTHLKAPKLTPELIERMVAGTKAQAKGKNIKELERFRDDCLIEVQDAIKRVKQKYNMAWDE